MTDEDLLERLAQLERKVDHLYAHLASVIPRLTAPLAPTPVDAGQLSENVRRLVDEGDLVRAIKQYREDSVFDLGPAAAMSLSATWRARRAARSAGRSGVAPACTTATAISSPASNRCARRISP